MTKNRSIRVRPICRAEPDLRLLARVLIDLVELEAAAGTRRRDEHATDEHPVVEGDDRRDGVVDRDDENDADEGLGRS